MNLFTVGVPVLILYTTAEPFHRGFFCDDQTIQHPYSGDTVTDTALGLGVAIVTVIPVSEKDRNACIKATIGVLAENKYICILPPVLALIIQSMLLDHCNNIVACHLPRGSKLRWREDMGGELPKAIL